MNKPNNEIWTDRFLKINLISLIPIVIIGLIIRLFDLNEPFKLISEITFVVFLSIFIITYSLWKWLRLSWGEGKEFKKFLSWSLVAVIGVVIIAISIAWYSFSNNTHNENPTCFGTTDIVRMCNPNTGEEKNVPSVLNIVEGAGECVDAQKLQNEGWQKCE